MNFSYSLATIMVKLWTYIDHDCTQLVRDAVSDHLRVRNSRIFTCKMQARIRKCELIYLVLAKKCKCKLSLVNYTHVIICMCDYLLATLSFQTVILPHSLTDAAQVPVRLL